MHTEHRRLIDALRSTDATEAGEVARRHVEVLHQLCQLAMKR
ncbi:hypothetical protein ACIA6D_30810 [Streptomyces cacaoi]